MKKDKDEFFRSGGLGAEGEVVFFPSLDGMSIPFLIRSFYKNEEMPRDGEGGGLDSFIQNRPKNKVCFGLGGGSKTKYLE